MLGSCQARMRPERQGLLNTKRRHIGWCSQPRKATADVSCLLQMHACFKCMLSMLYLLLQFLRISQCVGAAERQGAWLPCRVKCMPPTAETDQSYQSWCSTQRLEDLTTTAWHGQISINDFDQFGILPGAAHAIEKIRAGARAGN